MQNDSIDNLRLDMNKKSVRGVIYVRAGDTRARTVHITLTSNGTVLDLSDAHICEILIRKPDGGMNDQAVDMNEQAMVRYGNELQYTFRTTDINVPGECKCQVMITFNDGAVITSPEFSVMVYQKTIDQNLEKSTNEYTAITQQLTEATELRNQTAQDADRAETAREGVENYEEICRQYSESASDSASNAALSEDAASQSADSASADKELTKEYRDDAETFMEETRTNLAAVEEKATEILNYDSSAKESAESAAASATSASGSATSAAASAASVEDIKEDSEAYAAGTRNGSPVTSTDPAYHNNSKYYAEQAEASLSKIDGIAVANASGESFALVPTSEGNALATHIFGMSTQNGTPTPSSPVDIVSSKADFRCVGKQLIPFPYYAMSKTDAGLVFTANEDGTITVNGTSTAETALLLLASDQHRYIEPGTYEVTLPEGTQRQFLRIYDNTNGGRLWDYNSTGDMVINQRCLFSMKLIIRSGETLDNKVFHPMLSLANVTDDTYEPHKHTDIITDLTLRAIEVTSSDNYNLVRDGKYYIADTVDWSEDGGYVLTRRVGTHTFDENSTGSLSGHNTADTIYNFAFPLASNDMSNASWITPNDNVFKYCLLDHFQYEGVTQANATRAGFFGNAQVLYLRMEKATASVWSDMQTWLASNNTEVIYPIVPTTEPLTSEQAQSLLSLKTYDVSTSINAQSSPEPTVELEYAKSQTTALALSGHNEALIAQELEGLYGAKNLIPNEHQYPVGTTSTLGTTTFTENEDGSITVNGTSTTTSNYYVIQGSSQRMFLKAGTYILSGCPGGGSRSTYELLMINSSDVNISPRNYGGDTSITLESDGYYGIKIVTRNGVTIDNLTFKPMLRLATNTSNTYQPYAMTNYELTKKIKELETALIELGGN